MPHEQSGQDQGFQRLYRLQRRAESLGARRDPQIDNYLLLLEHQPRNQAAAEALTLLLDSYEEQQQLAPNWLAPPPGPEELYSGSSPPDCILGHTTETGVDYGPRILEDCGSIVVTGISGGGKTTLVQNLIVRLHRQQADHARTAVLVFDVKGDHTCLAALPHPAIHVHKLREELRLRMLRPPEGVSWQAWLGTVATYLGDYRGLRKSRHVFVDAALRLGEHFGIQTDPGRPWPSLVNVLDYLVRSRGPRLGFKEAEYRASLINELKGLLHDTDTILDTSDGVDLEEHLLVPGGITVLRMETLPVPAQQFIISLAVERIIQRRIARNVHNVGLEVLIVLDEAQLVLSLKADRESTNGLAPLASQLLRGREMGVGFIVVPHLLSDISRAVLASARTMFVVGGLSDAMNIDLATQMMNLPARARSMIPRLGPGQALVREIGTGGNYTDAFLVDLDPPEMRKNAIDEPTRARMMAPRRAGFPAAPSRPLTDFPSVMTELFPRGAPAAAAATARAKATSTPAPPVPPISTAQPSSPLTSDEMDLLFDSSRYWDDWLKERQERLRIGNYKVLMESARALEGQGLIALHDLRIGRSTYSFIEVTALGWQTLGQPQPAHYSGRGNFPHTVASRRLAARLTAQGWQAVGTEFRIGQALHPVDVYGRSPAGVRTAFEITFSHSNVVGNAVKTLTVPGAVDELIFLCPVLDECRKVEKLLQRDTGLQPYLSRIRVRRLDEFVF